MKKFKFTINEKKYNVNVMSFEDNHAKVDVNGKIFEVEVESKPAEKQKTPQLVRTKTEPTSTDSHKATLKTASPGEKRGTGSMKAPLPGTIVKIFVSEGDSVKEGTNLLVFEAMKMENNLHSDRDGKVKSIKVKIGDTVSEGDVLIEIE